MAQIKLLGVLSDVHNDVSGLEKALFALKYCDKIIHLGDLVEGDAEGNEVINYLLIIKLKEF